MTTIYNILLAASVTLWLSGMFYYVRLGWVGRQRKKLFVERPVEYFDYEDLETMIRRFWIWDIEKFRKDK